jgi:hypothetical protein
MKIFFSGLGTTKAAAGSIEAQRKIDYDLNLGQGGEGIGCRHIRAHQLWVGECAEQLCVCAHEGRA